MSNINLWKASDEYYQLCEQLYNSIDEDGVVAEQAMSAILEARETFEGKAVAVAMVYRQFDKDIASIDEEIERLDAHKKSLNAKKERLKRSLSDACEKTGVESIKGIYANISFRASEETVIDNENILPEEFKRTTTKITVSADKTKIKAAIKAGQVVAGAHIEKKMNLQIK